MVDRESMAKSFARLFGGEQGQRVLEQLKRELYVREFMTPEERDDRPIDPWGVVYRNGLRAAYWKIIAWIEEGSGNAAGKR